MENGESMFEHRITLNKENPQVEYFNRRWELDYEQDVQFMNHRRVQMEREKRREARQRLNRESVERYNREINRRRLRVA